MGEKMEKIGKNRCSNTCYVLPNIPTSVFVERPNSKFQFSKYPNYSA